MVAARDRLARLWDFYAFHQQLQAVGEPLRELAGGLQEVQRTWAELAAHPGEDTMLDVERTIARVETDAVAVDARIPVWRFRRRLAERHLPADVMLRYAALLARFLEDEHVVRRARIEYLAAEVIGLGQAMERKHVAFDEAEPLLAVIAGGRVAKKHVRARADAFFREQLSRVMAASGVAEVFEQGLLLDIEGFKSTLGDDLFDPVILHGAITVRAAMRERLYFLAGAEGRPAGEVRYLYWKTELQLQRLLRRSRERRADEAPSQTRLAKVDWGRHKWRVGLSDRLPSRKAAKTTALPSLKPLALMILVGFAAVVLMLELAPKPEATLESVGPARVSLSLSSAVVSGDALVATIQPERWSAMSVDARRALAEEVRASLPSLGARSAMVRAGDKVALQIDGGAVRMIDGVGGRR